MAPSNCLRRLLPILLLLSCTAAPLARAAEAPDPGAPDGPVPVHVRTVGLDTRANVPVVVLEAEGQDRILLIFVGHAEAAAIARRLQNDQKPPRPMTHDLLNNVIARLGGSLSRVVVTRIADGTFYGELVVRQDEQSLRIDTRPSDAMALALRADAPIFVAREVLDEAGLPPDRVPEKLPPEPKPRPEPKQPPAPQRAI